MGEEEIEQKIVVKQHMIDKHITAIQYTGMALLLFFFFWITRHAIFGAQEEYGLFYIVQKGDFFAWLNYVSRSSGRITFYALSWFWAGPMWFSDPIVYKISICLLTTLDVMVFYRLLSVHVNRRFAAFAVTFLIIMFQISSQHNLLIAYNYLHIPFILLMLSAHFLLKYCRGMMGYTAMILSALCSFAASWFQENFVLFYFFSFCIMFYYVKEQGFWKRVGTSLWKLKFHVLGGAIFLTSYFLFRLFCSTGSYSGNEICLSQPMTSLKVLGSFIVGMVPGRTFKALSENVGVGNLLQFVGKKDFIIIILGTVFICFLLHRIRPFKKSIWLYGALALCSVLACILHSVSLQYVTWVSGGATYAYVPSYYCCFFINTIICLLVHEIYGRLKKNGKRVIMVIFAVGILVFSTMTVATNKYYDREYQTKFNHYETYRDFFEDGGIDDWEDKAQVLLDDDYPVFAEDIHQCMTTVRYDAFFFTVTTDINKIDKSRNYYVLTYKHDKIETRAMPAEDALDNK